MRKYQAAWNQLRDNPKEPLIISAPAAWHQRIFKAITKEKDIDLVFKHLMSDDNRFTKLSRKSNGNQLIVRLRIYLGMSDF